ncbi:hypothetical protein EN12_23230 [Vibrio cholerae]|nr:hypothetical protein EN12_23230 [Vibrio cholerae]
MMMVKITSYPPHWWLKEQNRVIRPCGVVIHLTGGLKIVIVLQKLDRLVIHLTGGLKIILAGDSAIMQ